MLGYENPDKPCDHKGNWSADTIAGFALRFCGQCGRSWLMIKLEDGGYGWEMVSEPEELLDVSSLGQAVQSVSADEDDGPVQSEPDSERRAGPPVPDVPSGLEPDTAPVEVTTHTKSRKRTAK